MGKLITIRAMEPEDLDLLYQVENDKELWDIGPTTVPYSRYVLHDYISNASGDIYTDKQVRMVVENEQHVTIGIVDLLNFDPKNRKAEVGIVICAPYRQQGYGKAVLLQLHHYAKQTLHLHQLYAIISSHNEASLSLFTQMEYHKGAVLKDWLFDGSDYQDAQVVQLFL